MIPALVALAALLAQPAPTPQAVTWFARNTTRVESWSYFEPRAGGGDPDYTFIANRLLFGLRAMRPRWELQAAGQYVQFGNLPTHAFGPGALGSGAAYYDASHDTASRGLYLKYLNVRAKDLAPGLSVVAGRFAYASGAEAASGDPKIEAVKRQRVDSRLIGEFEWSLYQRSFDGVRVDWTRGRHTLTGAWFRPTQGGFEEDANVHIADVNLGVVALTASPGAWLPRTDAQVFMYVYDDTRPVAARPDNSGRTAAAADVSVLSFGTTLVSAVPRGAGTLDTLLWAVGQAGDWYGEDHRAWAVAAEAGFQWADAPARPWLRGGVNLSSGDGDPSDASHGTFFQMLPTARKYSFSTVYTQMNLRDVFAQLMLRPSGSLSMRVDLHRLWLMQARDRWYFGSGVTQKEGTGFGYGTRSALGATSFGTVLEGSIDYAFSPRWSVNGYAAWVRGADVVERLFTGRDLAFVYIENVLQF